MRERDRLAALKQTTAVTAGDSEEKSKSPDRRKKKARIVERKGYARRLLQAGIDLEPRRYVAGVLCVSALAAYLLSFIGWLIAVFMFIAMSQFLLWGFLDERAAKRKKKVVPQLAPFIDGLASALATGFNLEAAFIQAAQGVPAGILRYELDKVCAALTTGFAVKEALSILRDRISGREITSMVVCLSLFATMGGHVLEPFRGLARKIREQQAVVERANRDLVMVRQAFYMIFFLALGVPAVLMLVQPEYLGMAFADTLGRVILQSGAAIILSALVIFKKMTNLQI